MKVLLINPPVENMIPANTPPIVDEEQGFFPPLGLMYIASYAEKHTQCRLEILDTQVEKSGYGDIKREIEKRKPDVVGITATTFNLVDALLVAKTVKEVCGAKTIIGGPHASTYPEETLGLGGVDFLVLGEGEITFTELLLNMDSENKLNDINGLAFRGKNGIVITKQRGLIDVLDELPFPARHLTPYKKYRSLLSKSTITAMLTSRGCPHGCIFCNRPHLGKKFRARSANNVVDEMEECTEMGIHEIAVYDDTFTLDSKRVLEICDEMVGRGLDITWDIRARVSDVDKEMLVRLKKAGCGRIHYGVESGNQDVLDVLRKGTTLDGTRKAFKITKEAGIKTLAYFMIGNPREGVGQIKDTLNFINEIKPDYLHLSVTTPFPATELYEMGLNEKLFEDYWRGFAKAPTRNFVPNVWEENLSREELFKMMNDAYRSFYTRPGYVVRKIAEVRSPGEFRRKAAAFFKLIAK